jgi:hypothetical protein
MIQLAMGKTIIVVILFALIIIVVATGERSSSGVTLKGEQGTYIEDMVVVSTSDGGQSGKLLARRADFTDDMNSAALTGVKLQVSDTVILSQSGSYDMLTGALSLRDDVRATLGSYELRTSEASYSAQQSAVTGEDQVTIVSGKMRITGRGMLITDEILEVRSDVRAEIYQSN